MAAKTVSVTLPGGTKATCSEEQAKQYAGTADSKAPAKKAASSKSSDEK